MPAVMKTALVQIWSEFPEEFRQSLFQLKRHILRVKSGKTGRIRRQDILTQTESLHMPRGMPPAAKFFTDFPRLQ